MGENKAEEEEDNPPCIYRALVATDWYPWTVNSCRGVLRINEPSGPPPKDRKARVVCVCIYMFRECGSFDQRVKKAESFKEALCSDFHEGTWVYVCVYVLDGWNMKYWMYIDSGELEDFQYGRFDREWKSWTGLLCAVIWLRCSWSVDWLRRTKREFDI